MNKQNKKIALLSIILVGLLIVFFYTTIPVTEAQQCVQYAPIVKRAGPTNIINRRDILGIPWLGIPGDPSLGTCSPSNSTCCCITRTETVDFGVPIGPDPVIAALRGFYTHYTDDDDHHMEHHAVIITSNKPQGGAPYMALAGTGVQFDVTVCHHDSSGGCDDGWGFRYRYEVAAWPL